MELLGKRFEIFRLGSPIQAASGKVFALERHLLQTKDLFNIFRIVFAAKAKKHTSMDLGAHEFVQDTPRLIDFDTGGPILAADSAPKRVVAIQSDDFARGPLEGVKLAGDHGSKRCKESGRVWNVTESFPL